MDISNEAYQLILILASASCFVLILLLIRSLRREQQNDQSLVDWINENKKIS